MAYFGFIRSLSLESAQIVFGHVTRYIASRKTRSVKLFYDRVVVFYGLLEIREILIDQPVRTDDVRNFLLTAAMCHQLAGRRHVDAVDVRVTDRGCRRREIHFSRARVPCHFDNLLGCGSANNGIVYEQDVLASKFEVNGIEFAPDRAATHFLTGHDKSPADIAILDKAFAIFHVKPVRDLDRAHPAGGRNRYDDIDIIVGSLAQNLVDQAFAHPEPGFVNRDIVDNRIRTGKINVFKNTRRMTRNIGTLTSEQAPLRIDKNRLSRCHIAHDFITKRVNRHTFRRYHMLNTLRRVATANHQRSNAMRVPERGYAVTDDHRGYRVPASTAPVHRPDSFENVIRLKFTRCCALQFMREHIEQYFGVRFCVEVTPITLHQHFLELGGVRQVAIVPQANAVR